MKFRFDEHYREQQLSYLYDARCACSTAVAALKAAIDMSYTSRNALDGSVDSILIELEKLSIELDAVSRQEV